MYLRYYTILEFPNLKNAYYLDESRRFSFYESVCWVHVFVYSTTHLQITSDFSANRRFYLLIVCILKLGLRNPIHIYKNIRSKQPYFFKTIIYVQANKLRFSFFTYPMHGHIAFSSNIIQVPWNCSLQFWSCFV